MLTLAFQLALLLQDLQGLGAGQAAMHGDRRGSEAHQGGMGIAPVGGGGTYCVRPAACGWAGSSAPWLSRRPVRRRGEQNEAEARQQTAQRAGQHDHRPAGLTGLVPVVGGVDAGDEAGGLGAGGIGAGGWSGSVRPGRATWRGWLLRLRRFVYVARNPASRGQSGGDALCWPCSISSRLASTVSSDSRPRMAVASSARRRSATCVSDSLAAITSGCAADMRPCKVAVRSCASTRPSFSRRRAGCESNSRLGAAMSTVGSAWDCLSNASNCRLPFSTASICRSSFSISETVRRSDVSLEFASSRAKFRKIAADLFFQRGQVPGCGLEIGLRHLQGLVQFIDHALGLGIANLLQVGVATGGSAPDSAPRPGSCPCRGRTRFEPVCIHLVHHAVDLIFREI